MSRRSSRVTLPHSSLTSPEGILTGRAFDTPQNSLPRLWFPSIALFPWDPCAFNTHLEMQVLLQSVSLPIVLGLMLRSLFVKHAPFYTDSAEPVELLFGIPAILPPSSCFKLGPFLVASDTLVCGVLHRSKHNAFAAKVANGRRKGNPFQLGSVRSICCLRAKLLFIIASIQSVPWTVGRSVVQPSVAALTFCLVLLLKSGPPSPRHKVLFVRCFFCTANTICVLYTPLV